MAQPANCRTSTPKLCLLKCYVELKSLAFSALYKPSRVVSRIPDSATWATESEVWRNGGSWWRGRERSSWVTDDSTLGELGVESENRHGLLQSSARTYHSLTGRHSQLVVDFTGQQCFIITALKMRSLIRVLRKPRSRCCDYSYPHQSYVCQFPSYNENCRSEEWSRLLRRKMLIPEKSQQFEFQLYLQLPKGLCAYL